MRDDELIELGRRTMEALGVHGPRTIQVFRDPQLGVAITDVNTRFGGAFPAPAYAALPGRSYPELIVAMAAGETVAPHVGEFRAGTTFTRYYWQLELDERMLPTGREIVPGGPPAPGRLARPVESRPCPRQSQTVPLRPPSRSRPPAPAGGPPTPAPRRRSVARRQLLQLRRRAARRPGLVPAVRHRGARQPALARAHVALGRRRSSRRSPCSSPAPPERPTPR